MNGADRQVAGDMASQIWFADSWIDCEEGVRLREIHELEATAQKWRRALFDNWEYFPQSLSLDDGRQEHGKAGMSRRLRRLLAREKIHAIKQAGFEIKKKGCGFGAAGSKGGQKNAFALGERMGDWKQKLRALNAAFGDCGAKGLAVDVFRVGHGDEELDTFGVAILGGSLQGVNGAGGHEV